MISIETPRGLWRDFLVFYPDRDQLKALAGRMDNGTVVRVRQCPVMVDGVGHLVWRRLFRTSLVNLDRTDGELLAGMHGTTRNLIRQGERMGGDVEIRWDGRANVDAFMALYREFRSSKPGVPQVRLARLRQYLAAGEVPVAYYRGEAVCAHVILLDEEAGRARLNLSASRRLASKGHAKVVGVLNRYLHWEEFQRYRDRGLLAFDFGGIGSHRPGEGFKQSFGGSPREEVDYTLAAGSARAALSFYESASRLVRDRRRSS